MSSGVLELVWSGELSDAHYDEFTFSSKLTDAFKAGSTVHFPTRQVCDNGEVFWKEIPAKGQDPHELERPAPGLKITKGRHHHERTRSGGFAAAPIPLGDKQQRLPLPSRSVYYSLMRGISRD